MALRLCAAIDVDGKPASSAMWALTLLRGSPAAETATKDAAIASAKVQRILDALKKVASNLTLSDVQGCGYTSSKTFASLN